jgi:hypothetical protein
MSINTWKPVTYSDAKPKEDPRDVPLPFVLTPSERDVALVAELQIKQHRRRQNERDSMQSLAVWSGDQHRWSK